MPMGSNSTKRLDKTAGIWDWTKKMVARFLRKRGMRRFRVVRIVVRLLNEECEMMIICDVVPYYIFRSK